MLTCLREILNLIKKLSKDHLYNFLTNQIEEQDANLKDFKYIIKRFSSFCQNLHYDAISNNTTSECILNNLFYVHLEICNIVWQINELNSLLNKIIKLLENSSHNSTFSWFYKERNRYNLLSKEFRTIIRSLATLNLKLDKVNAIYPIEFRNAKSHLLHITKLEKQFAYILNGFNDQKPLENILTKLELISTCMFYVADSITHIHYLLRDIHTAYKIEHESIIKQA